MRIDYLKKILTSRVYDLAIETPLELAPNLSQRTGNRIYFKREDMQSVFSSSCVALTTRWRICLQRNSSAA
jgi:threonine dehydratase